MHPKNDKRISDAIKSESYDITNPILKALSTTGYDLEDLSALTCINKIRLKKLCYYDLIPTEHEKSSIKMVLKHYD